MKTLWFKVENGPAAKVKVNDTLDIDELKQEIIQQHSYLFPQPTGPALWNLYKSDQAQEPENSKSSISILGNSGTVDGPEIVLRRVPTSTAPAGFFILMIVNQSYTGELNRIQALKRTRSAASLSSRGSSGKELSQDSFRQRVLARDECCLLTQEQNEWHCEACHIIPWRNFPKPDLIGNKLWDTLFLNNSCDNPEHRVMDVRNGIFMGRPLNEHFDKFDFTIVKTGDVYYVKTPREDEFEPKSPVEKKKILLIVGLNGKKLSFNPEKKNEWPGENFLRIHNACYESRWQEFRLKAQAEAIALEEDDSVQTIAAERSESVLKVQMWNTGKSLSAMHDT
jgi:hypothetical protein